MNSKKVRGIIGGLVGGVLGAGLLVLAAAILRGPEERPPADDVATPAARSAIELYVGLLVAPVVVAVGAGWGIRLAVGRGEPMPDEGEPQGEPHEPE